MYSSRSLFYMFWGMVVLPICFLMFFPFMWLFFSSFKTSSEVFSINLVLLPSSFSLENYVTALSSIPIFMYLKNTLFVAIISIAGQLITCSAAAYALGGMEFTGSKYVFIFIVASMIIPHETSIVSNFLTVKNLGLIDTYLGMAALSLTSVMGIFILRQFFKSVPDEITESARIDGCNEFSIFFNMMLPLSKPALATISIFAFMNSWNSYLWPLVVTNNNKIRTIQVGLKFLIDPELGANWPAVMAATSIFLFPAMIVFVVLQRYFVEGVARSGLK